MCPTTIERAISSRPPSIGAPVAVAELDEVFPSIDAEVSVWVRARHMRVGPVGARRPVRAAADRRVGEDRDVRAEPLRADEPLREPALREVLVLERPDALGEVHPGELLLVHLAVPRARAPRPIRPSTSNRMHFIVASAGIPICSTISSIVTAPGVSTSVSGSGSSERGLRRSRRRGLRVREVVTVLAPNEEVLPDVGERHELVVHAATDRGRGRPRRSRSRDRADRTPLT